MDSVGRSEGVLKKKQGRIPAELAGKLATVLRESETDKEEVVRTSMSRLQQQQMLLRSKLDRVYEDRLSDAIPEELWNSKSAALQDELRQVRIEMERHEVASQAYETAGLQILELAQAAYSSYVAKNPHEQARFDQNACIELHVRSRKSFAHLR